MAIRWEAINFTAKIAYVEGNLVRVKGGGIRINHGKTAMARRPIPLADWLVDLLHDRRERVAALHAISTDEVTGWVFPNSQGGLREASNLRRDWRAFRERHNLGTGSPPTPSAAPSPRSLPTSCPLGKPATSSVTPESPRPPTPTSDARSRHTGPLTSSEH